MLAHTADGEVECSKHSGPEELYTVYLTWEAPEKRLADEEIDVLALSDGAARKIADRVLAGGFYVPGGQILHVEKRPRGVMFF